MQKIISVFQRNYETDCRIRDEVVPGADWVLAGEGLATRKFDGTCCLVRDGKLYRRYDAKKGKTPPAEFEPAQKDSDPITGHWPGWIPVGDGDNDRWHREAWNIDLENGETPADGTYELIGPKIQGNAENMVNHVLVKHGAWIIGPVDRTFDGIRKYLEWATMVEGIVFHHPDGRMAKVKRKDYGLPWPIKGQ